MIPRELFKKVRQIEITTARLVTDVFAGQYHSVFKGQGIEFDEVREYQIGDDIRTIDWNVTARTGKAHIKKYVEERELTVMILVDISPSCRFASVNELKSQLAAEISALLALAAVRNNDKVGLILFTDRIERFIPPRKGSAHVLRIIREVLYPDIQTQGRATDLIGAIDYLNNVTTRKSIAFLISDFLENIPGGVSGDSPLRKKLSIANKRHDLIAITLNDPREQKLPNSGLVALKDAETEETIYVDSSNPKVRENYYQNNLNRLKRRETLFKSLGMDFIDLATDSSYSNNLVKFFLKRRRRQSR